MRIEITDTQREVLATILPDFSEYWAGKIGQGRLPRVVGYWLHLSPIPDANVDLLARVEATVDNCHNVHEARAALLLSMAVRSAGFDTELVDA